MNTRTTQIALPEGDVFFQLPEPLTLASIRELEELLAIQFRRLHRNAIAVKPSSVCLLTFNLPNDVAEMHAAILE